MNSNDAQWVAIVQELGSQIGSMAVQLASANARIKELEQERVTDDGSTKKHGQRNPAEGRSEYADANANAGKTSTL